MRPLQERGSAAALTVRHNRVAAAGAVAAAVVAFDQLSKTWAVHRLTGRDIHVVGTLRLHLTYNSGGAFSLFTGSPWVFVVAGAALVAVMLGMGRRLSSAATALALGLVVGGAVGNLSDRLFRDTGGAVIDFIDLQWWPIFNVADAAVVCGALLLALTGWRRSAEAG